MRRQKSNRSRNATGRSAFGDDAFERAFADTLIAPSPYRISPASLTVETELRSG